MQCPGVSERVPSPHPAGRGDPLWLLLLVSRLPQGGESDSVADVVVRQPRERFFTLFRMTAGKRGVSLVVAFALALSLVVPAAAVDSTPIAFDADPALCTIEARSLRNLEDILAQATPASPLERPPTGDPIDPMSATGQGAIATIEALFSCLNAGDRLRAYALYTDAYLATILQPGDLPGVATPQPIDPDELTRIVAIELHTMHNDAIIAKVTLDLALIPVDKIFEFILVLGGNQWKIDAVINEIDFSIP